MMRKNVGGLDRASRFGAGAILLLAGLFLLGGLQGQLAGIAFAIAGAAVLMTGFLGMCLFYIPFGINTAKRT